VQILIYDKVQVKKIARPVYKRLSTRRFSTWGGSFIFTPLGEEFESDVLKNPTAEDGQRCGYNTIIFVSQHRSGLTWIRRLPVRDAEPVRKTLGRILRMYHMGDLVGDLLIHKTQTHTVHRRIEYPYRIMNDNDSPEYWFITGSIEWFDRLRKFRMVEPFYARDESGASLYDVNKVRLMGVSSNDIQRCESVERDYDEANTKFWLRTNWINLIRKNYNPVLFSEIIKSGGRAGFAMYKDGRAYRFNSGASLIPDVIKVHPRRDITAFPLDYILFPPFTEPPYMGTEMADMYTYEDWDGLMRLQHYYGTLEVISDEGEVVYNPQ
jgi:hypothetical protein